MKKLSAAVQRRLDEQAKWNAAMFTARSDGAREAREAAQPTIDKLRAEVGALRGQVDQAHNHILHLDHQLLVVRAAVMQQWALPGLAPARMIVTASRSIERPDGRETELVARTPLAQDTERRT